jgi:hypothetical protein
MSEYQMIPQAAVDWFANERTAGRMPRSFPKGALDPPGAFDAKPRRGARDQVEEPPPHIAKQLDALGDDSARQVHSYLGKRLARDFDPGDVDDWQDGPAAGSHDEESDDERLDRICSLSEEAGVPAAAIAKVREQMLGTGPVRSSASGAISGGPYDPANRRHGIDEPPPFPAAPRAGGGQLPYASSGDADRHAALENMKRIRSLTPCDRAYKDGVPFTGTMPNGDEYIHGALLRRPARDMLTQRGQRSTPAMDAASAEDFFTRFPDARRLRKL